MLNEHTGCNCILKNQFFGLKSGHHGRVIADDIMISILWDGKSHPITMYRHEIDIIPAMAIDGVYCDER